MKTLNAKRITTIAAGAALLGLGLAFAGPITFQNVPIVSATGQPLAQIVIGSTAQPWDGVSAGNIAAAIGNLAYASVPVTASVNATQAQSVLKVQVSSASYKLSNQQVWLNESGSVSTSGSYQFGALIGSVLNGAIILSAPAQTKSLQAAGSQYAYTRYTGSGTGGPSIIVSPVASPYSTIGFVPLSTSPQAASNGGGVSFTTFTLGNGDNLMQITNAQLGALQSNNGGNGANGWLWLTGFPVYDQATSVQNFQLLSAGGAYQVTFNKPIQRYTSSGGTQINVPITLLGQSWTIINETPPSTTTDSQNVTNGGKLKLAASLAPLTTVYVGHNITSGAFTVQLTDLGQPNANGVSVASLNIYYNNVLTNVTQVAPQTTTKYNVSGNNLYVNVNQTFAGLYAYQKWAKIQLYNNVYNLTDGKVFNQTTNPGWYVKLLWTNTTSTSASAANALQSIVIYNITPTNLAPGQSFSFIQSPSAYKVTFIGDELGSGSFDNVQASTSSQSSINYQNVGTNGAGIGESVNNVTEPGQILTVTSQIGSAFSFAGQTSSSVPYLLTPYALNEAANSLASAGATPAGTTNVVSVYSNVNSGSWLTSTNPVVVTITGYTARTATSPITESLTVTSAIGNNALGTALYNVTGIQVNRALPGALYIGANVVYLANNIALSTLTNTGPGVLYTQNGKVWQALSQSAAGNTIYNQQSGQPTATFILNPTTATGAATVPGQYFTYAINEIAVPTNTAATDQIKFGIDNATGGVQATPLFQVNYTATTGAVGTHNNVSYTSTSGTTVNAQPGFRTERGSKVATISGSTDTFSLARQVDYLQIAVAPSNTIVSSKSYKLYGPYGIGQATNIANVSIGAVNASIQVGNNSNFTITGIGNIDAVPSVANSDTPVLLKSLSSTAPLVILDSQAAAAPQSNYILVGSGFVNTLSQQLQSSYNVTFTPSSAPIMQAYGANRILIAGFYANQTNAAANNFINALYAQATT